MKIISMEPTPSPYSMKINVNETLPDGQTENYKSTDNLESAPDYIKKLFAINGVKGLYRVIDFIALERNPRVSWEEILPEVRKLLGSEAETTDLFSKAVNSSDNEDTFGEIKVFIQMFRNLPTQVKLQEGEKEQRFALPERFMNVAMEAATASDNYLMERKWVEQSARYGNIEEIGSDVVEELSATYDSERLNQLLATAYLGMIEEPETLPYLYKALKDKSVNVRRTAGDCLSDLGFQEAIPEMIKSLSDKSRIVRWRAAMFLYEVGDETAIPALQVALEDPEFEVRMQAKMALARIEEGKEAEGSIWHQMSQATKEK